MAISLGVYHIFRQIHIHGSWRIRWQGPELEWPSIEVYAAAFHLGQCSSILHMGQGFHASLCIVHVLPWGNMNKEANSPRKGCWWHPRLFESKNQRIPATTCTVRVVCYLCCFHLKRCPRTKLRSASTESVGAMVMYGDVFHQKCWLQKSSSESSESSVTWWIPTNLVFLMWKKVEFFHSNLSSDRRPAFCWQFRPSKIRILVDQNAPWGGLPFHVENSLSWEPISHMPRNCRFMGLSENVGLIFPMK